MHCTRHQPEQARALGKKRHCSVGPLASHHHPCPPRPWAPLHLAACLPACLPACLSLRQVWLQARNQSVLASDLYKALPEVGAAVAHIYQGSRINPSAVIEGLDVYAGGWERGRGRAVCCAACQRAVGMQCCARHEVQLDRVALCHYAFAGSGPGCSLPGRRVWGTQGQDGEQAAPQSVQPA